MPLFNLYRSLSAQGDQSNLPSSLAVGAVMEHYLAPRDEAPLKKVRLIPA